MGSVSQSRYTYIASAEGSVEFEGFVDEIMVLGDIHIGLIRNRITHFPKESKNWCVAPDPWKAFWLVKSGSGFLELTAQHQLSPFAKRRIEALELKRFNEELLKISRQLGWKSQDLSKNWVETFERQGMKFVGDLVRVSSGDMIRRFGKKLSHVLLWFQGSVTDFPWVQETKDKEIIRERFLDEEITQVDVFEEMLHEDIVRMKTTQGFVGEKLRLDVGYRGAWHGQDFVFQNPIELPRDIKIVVRQLHCWLVDHPVDSWRLTLFLNAAHPKQMALWAQLSPEFSDFTTKEEATQWVYKEDLLPERSIEKKKTLAVGVLGPAMLERPLWMFQKPMPVINSHRYDWKQKKFIERIAGFDGQAWHERDYYRVRELKSGDDHWVFFEKGSWFCAGKF